MPPQSENSIAFWRDDIDSLAFRPEHHQGVCVVHRRAFRALLGQMPSAETCLDYFARQRSAFAAAATRKIAEKNLAPAANFHLTSRDVLAHLDPFAPPL